jgi:hypothetical protein
MTIDINNTRGKSIEELLRGFVESEERYATVITDTAIILNKDEAYMTNMIVNRIREIIDSNRKEFGCLRVSRRYSKVVLVKRVKNVVV